MSFEGDTEYLCRRGHYQRQNAHMDCPRVCGQHGCQEPMEWEHTIDLTNGYEEEYEWCHPAPTTNIGWDDIPQTDHHNNRYFIKLNRYQPGERWIKAPTPEKLKLQEQEIKELREKAAKINEAIKPYPNHFRICSGAELIFRCDTEAEAIAKWEELCLQHTPDLSFYDPDHLEGS